VNPALIEEAWIASRSAHQADLAVTLDSLLLGFLARWALPGDVDLQMHARGIAALLGGSLIAPAQTFRMRTERVL